MSETATKVVADQERNAEARLKLHLRKVTIGRRTYRVLTLRPGTKIAFSTNFFHGTWHIVTSRRGSRLLARLLWGLSYAHKPDTLLVIHGQHLLPTPFEAERSDPIVLAPAGLTRVNGDELRILKARIERWGPPTTTVRLLTFGLDQASREDRERPTQADAESEWLWRKENRRIWRQERMMRIGGVICYTAPPAILREQALRIHSLWVRQGNPNRVMDYHFLAQPPCCPFPDGEVQIFTDYIRRVRAAVKAREEVVVNPKQPVLSEEVQEAISRRRDWIKACRDRRKSC